MRIFINHFFGTKVLLKFNLELFKPDIPEQRRDSPTNQPTHTQIRRHKRNMNKEGQKKSKNSISIQINNRTLEKFCSQTKFIVFVWLWRVEMEGWDSFD